MARPDRGPPHPTFGPRWYELAHKRDFTFTQETQSEADYRTSSFSRGGFFQHAFFLTRIGKRRPPESIPAYTHLARETQIRLKEEDKWRLG